MKRVDSPEELQKWMLEQARLNPKNPLYAHLQARAAFDAGEGEKEEKKAVSVRPTPLPVAPKKVDSGEDAEVVGETDDCEIIEGEE